MKKQFWRATLVMGGARIESEHESRLTDEEVFAHHKLATRPKNAMVEWIPVQKDVASAPVETAAPTKWHDLPDPAAIDWSKEFKETLQNLLPKIDALRVAVERELRHRDEVEGSLAALEAATNISVRSMMVIDLLKLLGERGLVIKIGEVNGG